QAYVDLARALMQKPEGATAAQEALVTAIRTMGESPRLMVMLGQVYYRQGRLDDAAAQFGKALGDPKSKNPDARLQLGLVYRDKKDYPKSVEQLTRASQEFIGQGSRIAEALTELGRTSGARSTPTPRPRTPTSSMPASSARTAGRGRRRGSPPPSTWSWSRGAITPP